jgi:peptidoglycan/xylan/chitin deacetylase (PgdA/CDA1 family)
MDSLTLLSKMLPTTKPARASTILVYHDISSEGDHCQLLEDSVTARNFEAQMKFLRDNSFEVISLSKLLSAMIEGDSQPVGGVVITFDDGYKNLICNALPVLKKYGIPATFFLPASLIGSDAPFPWLTHAGERPSHPMTWDNVRNLCDEGFEIGSHSLTHRFMPALSEQEVSDEVLRSKDVIEKAAGTKVCAFAHPFSFPMVHRKWRSFRNLFLSALKQGGYRCCCTMARGHVDSDSDPFQLNRIPIGKSDDLDRFRAKLCGYYVWTRPLQRVYQSLVKRYDLPLRRSLP